MLPRALSRRVLSRGLSTKAPGPPSKYRLSSYPAPAKPNASSLPEIEMPVEHYAGPAAHSLSIIGRVFKYLVIGTATVATIGVVTFEVAHQYVEHVKLAPPSEAGDDSYGWAEEADNWSGGLAGGTSSRLGFKARHAVRGAWICLAYGAGSSPGTIAASVSHTHGPIAGPTQRSRKAESRPGAIPLTSVRRRD